MFNEPACRCGTLAQVQQRSCSITLRDRPHVAKLKEELDVTKSELQGAGHNLDRSKQEQNAIIDEPLSVNGEHQSIRKELRASKDELQSLKEELAALNAQIQETLKRQCKAYNDLQSALHGNADEKPLLPIGKGHPLAYGEYPLEGLWDSSALVASRQTAARQAACLTPRQREIMELVLAGRPSKNIAAHLGISQRTVENHRASIMKKTGSKSLPALTRWALFAAASRAYELVFLGGPPVVAPRHDCDGLWRVHQPAACPRS
jgi:DNA-binding CsgD family transcriptional regulator